MLTGRSLPALGRIHDGAVEARSSAKTAAARPFPLLFGCIATPRAKETAVLHMAIRYMTCPRQTIGVE